MLKAFIKTDEHENPEVLRDLVQRLQSQNIVTIPTSLNWRNILETEPFLYFRNPYLRFQDELKLLKFHQENFQIPYIASLDKEVISVSPLGAGKAYLTSLQGTFCYRPTFAPLPIFLGTSQRSEYLKFTLNSILYHSEPSQKIYILLTEPNSETLKVVNQFLSSSQIEAVVVEQNLGYAVGNFGSKFFGLKKFINFEDDVLFPESLSHKLPYWSRQLAYRSSTADLVSFYISQDNNTADFYKSEMFFLSQGMLKVPSESLWHYTKKDSTHMFPIGGMGTIIDSPRMQKGFVEPFFHKTDAQFYQSSQIICICNVPIYHIGSNQKMDYPEYVNKKKELKDFKVNRFQTGIDLRTKETKRVDLSIDWSEK